MIFSRWTDDGWNDPKPIFRIIGTFLNPICFQIDQTRFQAQYPVGLDSCGAVGAGDGKKNTPQSYV